MNEEVGKCAGFGGKTNVWLRKWCLGYENLMHPFLLEAGGVGLKQRSLLPAHRFRAAQCHAGHVG